MFVFLNHISRVMLKSNTHETRHYNLNDLKALIKLNIQECNPLNEYIYFIIHCCEFEYIYVTHYYTTFVEI